MKKVLIVICSFLLLLLTACDSTIKAPKTLEQLIDVLNNPNLTNVTIELEETGSMYGDYKSKICQQDSLYSIFLKENDISHEFCLELFSDYIMVYYNLGLFWISSNVDTGFDIQDYKPTGLLDDVELDSFVKNEDGNWEQTTLTSTTVIIFTTGCVEIITTTISIDTVITTKVKMYDFSTTVVELPRSLYVENILDYL